MQPDLREFLPYVDDLDMTEEEKLALIHTIWTITGSFADRAFGLHPAQQCRALPKPPDSTRPPPALESGGDSLSSHFKDAGDEPGEG